MSASALANALPLHRHNSYLELGLAGGITLASVEMTRKWSVDIISWPGFPPTHQMTTDQFFAQLPDDERFDCIYIDACHEYDYVVRDFNNAVKHLTPGGIILVHDLVPPSKDSTPALACGDGFRILYQLWDNPQFRFYTQDDNYGLTVFLDPPPFQEDPEKCNVTYQQFMDALKTRRLYSLDEMLEVVRNLP